MIRKDFVNRRPLVVAVEAVESDVHPVIFGVKVVAYLYVAGAVGISATAPLRECGKVAALAPWVVCGNPRIKLLVVGKLGVAVNGGVASLRAGQVATFAYPMVHALCDPSARFVSKDVVHGIVCAEVGGHVVGDWIFVRRRKVDRRCLAIDLISPGPAVTKLVVFVVKHARHAVDWSMVVIHGGSCADLEIVFAREKGAVVRRWIWRRCGGCGGRRWSSGRRRRRRCSRRRKRRRRRRRRWRRVRRVEDHVLGTAVYHGTEGIVDRIDCVLKSRNLGLQRRAYLRDGGTVKRAIDDGNAVPEPSYGASAAVGGGGGG